MTAVLAAAARAVLGAVLLLAVLASVLWAQYGPAGVAAGGVAGGGVRGRGSRRAVRVRAAAGERTRGEPMSRYGDDGDYDYDPVAQRLWDANYERALKGKRGRKALTDLREALLALPEPRLIEGALCTVNPERRHPGPDSLVRFEFEEHVEDDGVGVCAIGALLWHRKVKTGMDPAEAFDSLPTYLDSDYDLHETARLAVRDAGIAYPMAWMLAYRNDEMNDSCTPEERYAAFLAWIDAELAGTAAA